MKNCDDCGRLVETTELETEGDTQNLCDRCLEWHERNIKQEPEDLPDILSYENTGIPRF